MSVCKYGVSFCRNEFVRKSHDSFTMALKLHSLLLKPWTPTHGLGSFLIL